MVWLDSGYRGAEKKQRRVKLADVDARSATKRAVENARLADKYLNPANTVRAMENGSELVPTVANFIEFTYLRKVEKRPATLYGYKHMFTKHLKDRLANIRMLDFSTATGQRLMRQIAAENYIYLKWL